MRGRVVVVTGPCSGGSHNVVLGVVADAEEEELHQFPSEVLVRRSLHVHAVGEVDQHGRLEGHLLRKRDEVAERKAAVQLVLVRHVVRALDHVPLTREQTVPEQRHLLLERTWPGGHGVEPPVVGTDRLVVAVGTVMHRQLGRHLRVAVRCEVDDVVHRVRQRQTRQVEHPLLAGDELGAPEQVGDVGWIGQRCTPTASSSTDALRQSRRRP